MDPTKPKPVLPYDVVTKIVEAMRPTPPERKVLESPLSKSEAGNVFVHLPLAVVANPFNADYARAKDKENDEHGSLVAAFNARMKAKPAAAQQAIATEWAGKGHLLPPALVDELSGDFDFLCARLETHPEALVQASLELQSEPALLLSVLRTKPVVLTQLPAAAMANNLAFLQEGTKINGNVLAYASAAMRRLPELCWAAVENQPHAVGYVDPEVAFFPELASAAVKANGLALADLPEAWRDERALVLAAVEQNGLALAYASDRLRNDQDLVGRACAQNRHALQHATLRLRNNLPFVTALVAQTPAIFRHAGEAARDNDALAQLAMRRWPNAVCHLGPTLQANRRYVKWAIKRVPSAILGVSPRYLASKTMVLLALEHPDLMPRIASLILLKASSELRADPEVVTSALMHDGLAIQYASAALRDDFDSGFSAVCNDGNAFVYLSARLRSDHQLAWTAMPATVNVYAQLEGALKDDAELALHALRLHREAVLPLLSPALLRDRAFVDQAITVLPAVLRYANVSPYPSGV